MQLSIAPRYNRVSKRRESMTFAECRDCGREVAGAEIIGTRSTSLDVQSSPGSGRAVHSFKPLVDDHPGGAQHACKVTASLPVIVCLSSSLPSACPQVCCLLPADSSGIDPPVHMCSSVRWFWNRSIAACAADGDAGAGNEGRHRDTMSDEFKRLLA